MFSQHTAQSNVTTSLFTVTPASVGSQRMQTMSTSSYKFGQVPATSAARMSNSNVVRMSAGNQDGVDQSMPNKFV